MKIRFLNFPRFIGRNHVILLFFLGLLLPVFLSAQTNYFRVVNGIPHLPVFKDVAELTAKVGTAESGMFFYSDKDVKIFYFNGTDWVDFCSEVNWTGAINSFQIKKGIPIFPSRDTDPIAPPPGGMFFSTKEKSVMMGDGNKSFHPVKDMRSNVGNFSERRGFSSIGEGENLLQLPVFMAPLPTTGVEPGAICINGTEQVISYYTASGWKQVNCDPVCDPQIVVIHLASGGVSPLSSDVSITYNIVGNVPGEPKKCWTLKNLGATIQASAVGDKTVSAAGWYWQFNKKQGYSHNGTSRSPGTTWISSVREDSNWLDTNDPCVLELKNGWRIPTYTEWYNVDQVGAWTNWTGPWNSILKLHAPGYLIESNGSLTEMGATGIYGSSSIGTDITSNALMFNASYSEMTERSKPNAYSLRCIKDLLYDADVPAQPGEISGSKLVCSQGCVIYTITAVAGATKYNWSYTGGGSLTVSSDGLSCTVCPPSIGYLSSGVLSVVAVNSHGTSSPRSCYIEVTSYTLTYGRYICKLRGVTDQKVYPALSSQGGGSTRFGTPRFYAKTYSGVITTDIKVDENSGVIDVSNSLPGFYYVCYEAGNGCSACASVDICDEPETPVLAYPEDHVCQYSNALLYPSVATPIAETTLGGPGMTVLGGFKCDDGLVVDYHTGAINVGASSVGSHLITYTPSPLCCPDSKATFRLRIDALPTLKATATDGKCGVPSGQITLDIDLHIPVPAPTAPSPQVLYPPNYTGGYVRMSDLSVTTSCGYDYVTWYDAPYGGNVLDGNTRLVSGKTYYASQCGSDERVAVVFVESSVPVSPPAPADPAPYPTPTDCTWTIYDSNGAVADSGTRNSDGSVTSQSLKPGTYSCIVVNDETGCVSNTVMVTIGSKEGNCIDFTLIPNCETGKTNIILCVTDLISGSSPYTNWTIGGKAVGENGCVDMGAFDAGSYPFTATDGSITATVTVEVPKVECCPPDVSIPNPITDCVNKITNIRIHVPSLSSDWSYIMLKPGETINSPNLESGSVSSGSTLDIPSCPPGVYTFIFTSKDGCGTITKTVTIECPTNCGCQTPVATILKGTTCDYKKALVQITDLPSAGNWTINPGGITGTGSSYVITLDPGIHTFTVTSSDGCISDPVTIKVPCPADCTCEPLRAYVVRIPDCDENTGDIVLENLPSGKWTINPGNYTGTGGTFLPINHLKIGTYTFTVTDEDGCISAPVTVTVKCSTKCVAVPKFVVGKATCKPQKTAPVTFEGLPEGDWVINPGNITGTGEKVTINLPVGTYEYTVSSPGGCASASFKITIECPTGCSSPCVTPTYNVIQPTCDNKTGSVVFSGLPTGVQPVPSVTTNLSSGSHHFTVTDLDGVVLLDFDVVIEKPNCPCILDLTYTEVIDCTTGTGKIVFSNLPKNWIIKGADFNESGSSGSYTFPSSDKGLPVGSYPITIINGETGCAETINVDIVCPESCCPVPVWDLSSTDCDTKKASVYVKNLQAGWTISPSTTTGLQAGETYTFVVKSSNGCESKPYTVTIPCPTCGCKAPSSVKIVREADCDNKTADISFEGLPSGNWTIEPGGYSGNGTSGTIKNVSVGTYTFTITDKDKCCTSQVTVKVDCPTGCKSTCTTPVYTSTVDCVNKKGNITISNLPSGEWTIYPGGYKGSGSSYTIPDSLPLGTYIFTVIDEDGYQTTYTVVVIQCNITSASGSTHG